MENITEETAQELANIFDGLSNSFKELETTTNDCMRNIVESCEIAIVKRLFYYIEKYTNATFLTRWYWLRKAKKINEALIRFKKEIANIYEEEGGKDEV